MAKIYFKLNAIYFEKKYGYQSFTRSKSSYTFKKYKIKNVIHGWWFWKNPTRLNAEHENCIPSRFTSDINWYYIIFILGVKIGCWSDIKHKQFQMTKTFNSISEILTKYNLLYFMLLMRIRTEFMVHQLDDENWVI